MIPILKTSIVKQIFTVDGNIDANTKFNRKE